jgi:hypothetical protein
VLLAGFALYLWYGLSIANRVLIVTNTVSLLATGLTLGVGLALRRRDRATDGSDAQGASERSSPSASRIASSRSIDAPRA